MRNLRLRTGFYFILFILGTVGLFSSCSPEYIPNMVNSPMFTNGGEFQATIATGTSNFDAQTAYAITDNIGIMVNGSYGDETSDSSDNFHKHTFIEGGIGYYDTFGDKGRYEIFGGYGSGRVEGYYKNIFNVSDITDARYNRYFIQPGIGIATGIFDGSFATRFTLVQMNPTGNDFAAGEYKAFAEPVITAKIGYRYVKFITQFGFPFHLGSEKPSYDYQHFIVNFGLTFNLGRDYYDF